MFKSGWNFLTLMYQRVRNVHHCLFIATCNMQVDFGTQEMQIFFSILWKKWVKLNNHLLQWNPYSYKAPHWEFLMRMMCLTKHLSVRTICFNRIANQSPCCTQTLFISYCFCLCFMAQLRTYEASWLSYLHCSWSGLYLHSI